MQQFMNVTMIKSPPLAKTEYGFNNIYDVNKDGWKFFVDAPLTPEEKVEENLQGLVNYDGFYDAPIPEDMGHEFKKFSKEKLSPKTIGMIAAIAAANIGIIAFAITQFM